MELSHAGAGGRTPFAIESLKQAGVWTPRPWSKSHPDTGSGDPSLATAEKGQRYFQAVTAALAELLVDLANATKRTIAVRVMPYSANFSRSLHEPAADLPLY